jgi:hypothetical protein
MTKQEWRDASLKYIENRYNALKAHKGLAFVNASPANIIDTIAAEPFPFPHARVEAYPVWIVALADYKAKLVGTNVEISDYSIFPLFQKEAST